MPLRFRPPLTEHEQKVLLSMPRTRSGNVTNPLYLPPEERAHYERELGQWCRSTYRSEWPQWVADYVDLRRAQAAQGARAACVDEGDDRAAVPGLAAGEV
jgi:hypothetical protein